MINKLHTPVCSACSWLCRRRKALNGWIWLCVMYFLIILPLNAQYVYRNYSSADGLPSATVYHCVQDSAGFMWFATDKGLCRFDGSDFVDMDMGEYEGKSLTTISLAINNNRIVAGTYGGFMMVDGLSHAQKIGVGPSDVDYACHRLAYKGDFLYYRTSDSHIAAYDLKRRRQYHIANQDIRKSFCMATTHDGRIYYGQTGVYTIKGLKTGRLDHPVLNNKEVSVMSVDADNQLWISSKNMIYCLKDNKITDSVKCGFYNGNPLFVYNSKVFGLLIYDHYGHGNKAYEALSALLHQGNNVCIITSLFEDKDGNFWINTYNKGTYCIFNSYITTFSGKSEVYDASIHDVYVNKGGETYMATSLGMVYKDGSVFNRLSGAKEHFYYNIYKAADKLLVVVASMGSNQLRKVTDETLGKTYYQMEARRLCMMNDSAVVFNTWDNRVFYAGLNFKDLSIKITRAIELDTAVGHCTAIFKKDQSHVIVATTDACYMVDFEKGTSVQMEQIKSKVNDIIADASGTIYLASEAGLYIMKHSQTYLLKEAKGMPLKNLSALAIDKAGRLWIGYNKGLLAWKGDFAKRISGSQYMRSHEINRLFYEPVTNQIYVATNSGLSIVNVNKMDRMALKKPDLVLLKVQSGDSLYDTKDEVSLMPNTDDVDIYFSAIEFTMPQDLYFRYTLNGGRSWTVINGKKISLRGLGYGSHQVMIQVSTNGMNWGKKSVVSLYRNYPFYMTFTFWSVVLVLVGVAVLLIVKWRIRKIRQKADRNVAMQQKLEELRYQALGAAVNPHFIFNTLGAIQSFVVNKDPFQVSDYIAKFARLIRITLNHAGEKYISIDEELSRLNLYLELEKLRCGDKMEYTIGVDSSIDKFSLIPNMIIQPLLENAILHGILPLREGITGRLELTMQQQENFLVICVRDNGVGITRHAHSKHGYVSIGIDNLRERLALIKGSEFSIKNLREFYPGDRGTLVEIRLPV